MQSSQGYSIQWMTPNGVARPCWRFEVSTARLGGYDWSSYHWFQFGFRWRRRVLLLQHQNVCVARRLCDGGRRKGSQTAQGGGTTLVSSTKNDGVLQQQPWRMVVAVPQQHSSKESAPNNLRCVWVCLYTSWMVVIVYMYVVASAKRGHITCFRILAYSTYKGISLFRF